MGTDSDENPILGVQVKSGNKVTKDSSDDDSILEVFQHSNNINNSGSSSRKRNPVPFDSINSNNSNSSNINNIKRPRPLD